MTETAVDYILTNFNNSISTANVLHTALVYRTIPPRKLLFKYLIRNQFSKLKQDLFQTIT